MPYQFEISNYSTAMAISKNLFLFSWFMLTKFEKKKYINYFLKFSTVPKFTHFRLLEDELEFTWVTIGMVFGF